MAAIVGALVAAAVWIWSSGAESAKEKDEPMLNATEWNTFIPILVAVLGPYLAKWGITDETMRNWLTALGLFATASYMVWSGWNQKRVAETAIVTGHAADAATATALSVPSAVKVIALLALLCLVALHAAPAFADPDSMPIRPVPIQLHVTKPAPGAPALTGNPVADVKSALGIPASVGPTGDVQSDLATIEKAISQDMLDDLTAAQAAYTALNDTAGGACNQELLTELTALKSAADAKGLPKLHLAFDFAIARTLVLAVSPNSKLNNACAPVVQQTGQSVLQLVTGILSGSASILPALGLQ